MNKHKRSKFFSTFCCRLLVGVSLFLLAGVVPLPAGSAPLFRLHGEYGLHVRVLADSLEVHWMTMAVDTGFVRFDAGGKPGATILTARSTVHRARLPRPAAGQFTLEYGSLHHSEDRHRTAIDFGLEKPAPTARLTGIDSIFVFGDVHGQFDAVRQLLLHAGLVDSSLSWRGGRAHLVFLGDLFDRGDDVTRVLWLIYGLEQQARRQGGRVHLVLGNHEIMSIIGDDRYLSPKEKNIADAYGTTYKQLFDIEASLLGRWLASKPGMLMLDDVLLAHGGITTNYARYPIDAFNDSLYAHLREPVFFDLLDDSAGLARYDSTYFTKRLLFFFGDLSPFWYRGYVQSDTLAPFLDAVLKHYKARLHVVAHTPVATIRQSYKGKLIAVDLQQPATEMLLLVRQKKKYQRFVYDLAGQVRSLH